jgi:PAS domain S-box-containing protein
LYWDGYLRELWGLSAEDPVDYNVFLDGIHPDDREASNRAILSALDPTSDGSLAITYRLITQGQTRWIAATGQASFEGNVATRFVGTVQDITERKKMEELAAQRLMEIEDIYRNAPVGLCVLDRDLRFLRINERMADINGIPAADHIGKTTRDTMPELADAIDPGMRRILETGEPRLNIEIISETPAHPGVKRIWMEQWLPIKDSQGQVVGLSIVVEEITERKRMEEALRQSRDNLEQRVKERTTELQSEKRRLSDIIHGTNVGTWEWNVQTGETTFSERWAEIIGYRLDELGPLSIDTWRKHAHLDDLALSDNLLNKHFIGELPYYECEARIRHKNGKWVWVLDRGRVVAWTDEGKPLLMSGTHQDITERKHLEEQIVQSHKMEAIGTLAGGIAHDFNNMLAVIIGNAELALDDIPEDEPSRHNLEVIIKASRRCRDLVRQILTFSRKDTSQQKNQPLAPLIDESLKFLRASIPSTIEMKLDINTKSDTARVNEAQFQQIIVNLGTNAAHAMREDGGLLHLSLDDETLDDASGTEPSRYLNLTVTDTGTGMDEGVKKRIFDPFFTTKKVGEGTGMGLAVVHGIVAAHNGLITVHSEPGKGSSFSILIPKTKEKVVLEGEPLSTVAGGRERILFIDDEDTIVEMTSALLEGLGYEVSSFTDPHDALAAFSRTPHDFDLVITDQTMPKMTGAMLANKVKAIRPDIPVMLCTGYSQTVSAEQAKSQGIEGYAMKPLVKREMAEAIHKVLGQSGDL